MLGLKLIHVSERGPSTLIEIHETCGWTLRFPLETFSQEMQNTSTLLKQHTLYLYFMYISQLSILGSYCIKLNIGYMHVWHGIFFNFPRILLNLFQPRLLINIVNNYFRCAKSMGYIFYITALILALSVLSPPLLTLFNFNPSMDKKLHPL